MKVIKEMGSLMAGWDCNIPDPQVGKLMFRSDPCLLITYIFQLEREIVEYIIVIDNLQ